MGSREVKTFDELCGEVCAELRGAGKSIDLCEKMKVFQSDLKRVQVLLMHNPRVVRKFTNCIGERREGKNRRKAEELLATSKTLPSTECERAIELLTRSLRLSPWRKSRKDSQDEINEFHLTREADHNCVQWLVEFISKNVEGYRVEGRCGENETRHHHHPNDHSVLQNDILSSHPAKNVCGGANDNDEKDGEDCTSSSDLLGNIYFERCSRLCQQGNHESAILDCVRGVICTSDNEGGGGKILGFTTVSAVGFSLKAMGYFTEAVLILNHALQLLRLDSTYKNQVKSQETINIVRVLKEIKLLSATQVGGEPSTKAAGVTTTATSVQGRRRAGQVFQSDGRQVNPSQTETQQQGGGGGRKQDGKQQKMEGKQVEQKNRLEGYEEEEEDDDDDDKPHVYGQAHPNLIAASDAIDLRYDETRGRHVVAKRTIPPGATLICDSPYSWSLCPPLYQTLCQHCCKKVGSGIPCQHCSSVVFCKWKCWQRSEHYHRFECAILKGLDSSEALGEMAVLCYRTVCRTSVRVLTSYMAQVECDEENENEKDDGLRDGDKMMTTQPNLLTLGLDVETRKLDPKQFSSVFAFTTNAEQRSAGDIVKRTLAAIYLTLCLRYTGYFQRSALSTFSSAPDTSSESQPQQPVESLCLSRNDVDVEHLKEEEKEEDEEGWKLSNVELQTAAFLLRLSQGLSCNAYGINSVVMTQPKDSQSPPQLSPSQLLGGASYPTISIINHSCNPNVFRLSSGNTCIVRSILEIQKGEEICDSYGPLYTTMPKSERKSILKSQYFFDCDCEACEKNWPLFKDLRASQASRVADEPLSSYKCPGCPGIPKKSSSSSSSSSTTSKDTIPAPSSSSGNRKDKTKNVCPDCGQKLDLRRVAQALARSEKNYLAAKDSLISTGRINVEQQSALAHHISILQKFLTSPHKLIVECQETLKLAWNAALFNSQS